MKKILLVISLLLLIFLAGTAGWLLMNRDQEGPQIAIDESAAVVYHANITDKELLEGVTASDEKDGDVTDRIVVESVEVHQEQSCAAVTYVALDNSNNVSRSTREIPLEAGYTSGEAVDTAEEAADPEGDGEAAPDGAVTATPEASEVPDARESQEQQTPDDGGQAERIAALSPEAPRLYLSQHQVTIQAGEDFRSLEWISDITDDSDDRNSLYRDIRVDGEVDANTAGTYELTYYVVDSSGNRSNEEVLTVTVTA